MKAGNWISRKRIQIIAVWLLFLVIFSIAAFRVRYRTGTEGACEALAWQAKNIGTLIPAMEKNAEYAKESIARTMPVRMNALAIGLDKYEDIEDALSFLEEFRNEASLESLVIYDADGRVIYGDEDLAKELDLDPEKVGERIKGAQEDAGSGLTAMVSVGERWLVIGRKEESPEETAIEEFYSLVQSLENISSGQEMGVTVISSRSGEILLCADKELNGRSMDEADIRSRDGTSFTDASGLETFLKDSGQPEKILMNGVPYLACLIDGASEDVLLIAMLPEKTVRSNTLIAVGLLYLFLLLATGMYTAYAFFHLPDWGDASSGVKKMAGKLILPGFLTVTAILGFSIYTSILTVYSNIHKSNQDMSGHALALYDSDQEGAEDVRNWSDAEYLARTRIARRIITDRKDSETVKEDLAALAEALEIEDIIIYDKNGVFQTAAYSYAQPNLDKDSPFFVLLQGRDSLVGEPEEDALDKTLIQKIGASMRDENGQSDGCILVSQDLDELQELGDIAVYGYLFRQLSAPYGSIFAAVDGAEEGILYLGTVQEDRYDEQYAEEGKQFVRSIQDLGIKEEQLRDDYDGSTTDSRGDKYIFSVRMNGEDWLILMQKWQWDISSNVVPAFGISLMALLYILILMVLNCAAFGTQNSRTGHEAEYAEEPAGENGSKRGGSAAGMIAKIENLFNNEKPYFEDRWPAESRKWNIKTPGEKFIGVSKFLFILFMVGQFILSLTLESGSMLAMCLKGEWRGGFYLHSITTILIAIGCLAAAKIIIHKILYVLARAAGSWGETICHLLDGYSGYILVITGILVCLNQLGVNTTELTLTSGILGIILGLGFENTVADMLAGILMVFEGLVHVGDIVYYEGKREYVISIGVRTTQLKMCGKTTVVRNDEFKSYVTVPAAGKVSVSAAFYTDLTETVERVEEIIAREMPVIHERMVQKWENLEGPSYWGVGEFSDKGIPFSVYVGCGALDEPAVQTRLNAELKMMCERNNIRLADRTARSVEIKN